MTQAARWSLLIILLLSGCAAPQVTQSNIAGEYRQLGHYAPGERIILENTGEFYYLFHTSEQDVAAVQVRGSYTVSGDKVFLHSPKVPDSQRIVTFEHRTFDLALWTPRQRETYIQTHKRPKGVLFRSYRL